MTRSGRPVLRVLRGGLTEARAHSPSPAVLAARSSARVLAAAQGLAAALDAVPGLLELVDGRTEEGAALLALLDSVSEYEAHAANLAYGDNTNP